jgi:phenylacetate-coenzyme A ligase PaaK-like adenylate-forming protein
MNTQIILSILSQMRQFRQRDHWTRQHLEAHQADALRSLRDDTYAHSPSYRRTRSLHSENGSRQGAPDQVQPANSSCLKRRKP